MGRAIDSPGGAELLVVWQVWPTPRHGRERRVGPGDLGRACPLRCLLRLPPLELRSLRHGGGTDDAPRRTRAPIPPKGARPRSSAEAPKYAGIREIASRPP